MKRTILIIFMIFISISIIVGCNNTSEDTTNLSNSGISLRWFTRI